MGPNPDLGGNMIGPNSGVFGGPRPGMPFGGDPNLGGSPFFQPMGINDLHPDLPGMGGNPMFPPNQ